MSDIWKFQFKMSPINSSQSEYSASFFSSLRLAKKRLEWLRSSAMSSSSAWSRALNSSFVLTSSWCRANALWSFCLITEFNHSALTNSRQVRPPINSNILILQSKQVWISLTSWASWMQVASNMRERNHWKGSCVHCGRDSDDLGDLNVSPINTNSY